MCRQDRREQQPSGPARAVRRLRRGRGLLAGEASFWRRARVCKRVWVVQRRRARVSECVGVYVWANVRGRWVDVERRECRGLGMLSVAASLLWNASTRMARLLADHRLPWTKPAIVARTRIRALLPTLIRRDAHLSPYHISPLLANCCHPKLALGGCVTALALHRVLL